MRKYLRRPNPLGQSPRRLDHLGHPRRRQGHESWATNGISQHLRSMSALPPKADIGTQLTKLCAEDVLASACRPRSVMK